MILKRPVAEAIGLKAFKPFGVNPDGWGYRGEYDLNMAAWPSGKLDAMETLLVAHEDKRGVKSLISDLRTWKRAKVDASGIKPRTVKQFSELLTQYLLKVPGHWVFTQSKRSPDTWIPYYVGRITYHPAVERRGEYEPAHVNMTCYWEEFGQSRSVVRRFEEGDCRGMTVVEALARQGCLARTGQLHAGHMAEIDRFTVVHRGVGVQYFCVGTGTDDCDGNREGGRDSWYWKRKHDIDMVRDGKPTRVVLDVFFEEQQDGRRGSDDGRPDEYFWTNVANGRPDDDEDEEEQDFSDDGPEVMDVPVHPYLAVFDLSKHLRLRVHVNQLSEYRYDQHLADKLILPEDRKSLVRLLIEMKAGRFHDIVQGKGGGAVVLLAGAPGTGKTLTAEVYAESEQRALYSVQCSQLGTDSDTLEDELLKVFARAKRWNAVMLLDEADVYVHERGNDMQQNAVVGVFLRVLEYQDSVLFLTTNRPDDVDDAIASRCIARLSYDVPSADDQRRIWRVLADNAQIPITDAVIDTIVDANRHLSGRDVKNLLKLAALGNQNSGDQVVPEITAEAIEFVKQFQPTGWKK